MIGELIGVIMEFFKTDFGVMIASIATVASLILGIYSIIISKKNKDLKLKIISLNIQTNNTSTNSKTNSNNNDSFNQMNSNNNDYLTQIKESYGKINIKM